MKKAIRILLVDDHPTVLEGLQRMLEREEDIEAVGQSADGEEALQERTKCGKDDSKHNPKDHLCNS